ncbi:MAG: acyl-CoA dehydratase activase-related protein [Nitrospirota bacterium]
MRIGIPQGLLYFRYASLWKECLSVMGTEVVSSPETTDNILADGIKHSVCDICLPVKAFFGHVLALKDNVDYLFIPRFIRIEPDAYLCPKFLGLPDMVQAAIRNLPPVIDTEFNIKEKTVMTFWQEVEASLKRRKNSLLSANMNFNGSMPESISFTPNNQDKKLHIGMAGRPYLVLDRCLNKGIIRYINKLGIIVTYHTPEKNYISDTMSMLPKWVYWSMGKEVVSSVRWMLENNDIDGIILLTNAGCGPDSFVAELIEHSLPVGKKPYMTLCIDEHTSDTGLQTRIEAFIDMVIRNSKSL